MATYAVWQATVTDNQGNITSGATVTVRNESTGLPADIFETRLGTAKANPFTTGADGFAQFYAAPGLYRIEAASPEGTAEWRNVRLVEVATEAEALAGTPGVLPTAEQVRKSHVATVNTWSDLETTFEPSFDGQQIELLGYSAKGIGGGMFYADFSDTTTASDGGTVAVTAGGKRIKRKFDGYVTPQMFGALGDGTDDISAILLMTSVPRNIDWGDYNYLVSSDIGNSITYTGSEIHWVGNGATITLSSPTVIDSLCRINLSASKMVIDGVCLDGQMKAIRGFNIRNTTGGMSDSNLSEITIKNFKADNFTSDSTQAFTTTGIIVYGAFRNVFIKKGKVNNVILPFSEWSSGKAATGVDVSPFGIDHYAINVSVEDVEFSEIKSDNPAANSFMNALNCFDPHPQNNTGKPLKTTFRASRCKFTNCWGRAVKSQRYRADIFDCDVYRYAGATVPSRPDFDFQIGGGSLVRCRSYYIGAVSAAFATHITYNSSFKESSILRVRDCEAFNETPTAQDVFVSTFAGDYTVTPVIYVSNSHSYGKFNRFGYITASTDDDVIANFKDCSSDEILLSSQDSTDGESIAHFIQVRNQAGTSPEPECFLSVEGCTYTGSTEIYPVWNRVNTLNISGYGNHGFLSGLPQSASKFERHPSPVFRSEFVAGQDSDGGSTSVQSAIIAPGATHVFKPRGYRTGVALNLLAIDFNFRSFTIFTSSDGFNFPISEIDTAGYPSLFDYGANSEPTATKDYQVWRDTSGGIAVKNSTAFTRRVTLTSIG